MKKLLSVLLIALMVLSLVACSQPAATQTKTQTQTQEQTEQAENNTPVADVEVNIDAAAYNQESWTLYNANLKDSYDLYQKALTAKSNSERFALFALSEGKLIGSGLMLPTTTKGGNYAIGRVAPRTSTTVLWGSDSSRLYKTIVVNSDTPILPAERAEMIQKWEEVKGTGTYEAWAKEYLAGKGYALKDSYNYYYTSDPQTWDALATYRAADTDYLVHTFDQLLEYDIENVQQPALATSYEVSEDGLTYTFHIRQGVVWVDNQGRKVADVKADDWVAGMQHLLDAKGGLDGLVAGDAFTIVGAPEYLAGEVDFSQVGVKATDDYTLVYTLAEPCSYFTSIFGYNPFAPLSRDYYTSQGGKFGAEFDSSAESYLYGKDPSHIAYCGPYVITNFTSKSTIVYKLNESYWNKDAVNAKTLTFVFNDGTDQLKNYNDMKAGTIDATGLNSEAVESAKVDGWFEKYKYLTDTDATSFIGFVNINRKAYANENDKTVARSSLTVSEAEAANKALQNVHVRRALLASVDRGAYNAQSVGEDLKYNALRNSYVPGNFVTLDEDVSVEINGTATTFKAGTYYGEIMQAQLDADNVKFTVWDKTKNTGDGYDGFFNAEYAKSELQAAIADGLTISKEKPVKIDWPYYSAQTSSINQANAVKQSVEAATDGLIQINLVDCVSRDNYLWAAYYPEFGYGMNAQFQAMSGWGPDYGDPQTYLATVLPDVTGNMIKACGLF